MIKKLPESEGNVYGYEASGRLAEEENRFVFEELTTAITDNGPVRVLLRADNVPVPELFAFRDRLQFVREHRDDIQRYAVVTDGDTLAALGEMSGKTASMEVRLFKSDDEAAAWRWLRADTVH